MTSKKAEAKQGKIYVGKLPQGEALSKEDIQNHFSEYGQVTQRFFLNVFTRRFTLRGPSVRISASNFYTIKALLGEQLMKWKSRKQQIL